ncbi:hypothetical protein ABEB36_010011 [Hypothenemus hampei]|uniref:F-box domain-containing protein n=1 Tax=Hypothenemus hampei TaxID=57062 RepID=A0ABD1EKB8_HYPHA
MDPLEEENDQNCSKGYYTRAKRRKLAEHFSDKEESSTSNFYRIPEVSKRKNPIMFLPTEVLQNVFKHISYHDLSSKIRLVNRRFRVVAEDLLNLGFKKIKKRLQSVLNVTEISLRYTQDDMETKCIFRLLCMIEILNLQYAVIVTSIWRYVYNEFYRVKSTCMYGGLIIDTFDDFLWKFVSCPHQLYGPAVVKDYALPHEVTKLVQMSKNFCIHFDKICEEAIPNSLIWNGCKVIDILDCAKFAQKIVHFERRTSESFFARYSYYFRNSWFIVMPIPVNKEMDWPQRQRMMLMRLRRIVLAHNDMYLQQEQYEREMVLRPEGSRRGPPVKKPGNNVYTGYGDVQDKFFYYGAMNDAAYMAKFHTEEANEEQGDHDPNWEPQLNEPEIELIQVNSDEEVLYRLPYLGFRVDTTIRCPIATAPLKFLNDLPLKDQQKLKKRKIYVKNESQVYMNFECLGAQYARLPTQYQFQTSQPNG